MSRREEFQQCSEPDTIISHNLKDASLRDIWEVSFDHEEHIHKGVKVSTGISEEDARTIGQTRGGTVIEMDSAFEI